MLLRGTTKVLRMRSSPRCPWETATPAPRVIEIRPRRPVFRRPPPSSTKSTADRYIPPRTFQLARDAPFAFSWYSLGDIPSTPVSVDVQVALFAYEPRPWRARRVDSR